MRVVYSSEVLSIRFTKNAHFYDHSTFSPVTSLIIFTVVPLVKLGRLSLMML